MSYNFYLSKIETRTEEINGTREYVVKGYATVPNHIYSYKNEMQNGKVTRSFKEYFSEKGIKNIVRKAKMANVFADIGHKTTGYYNIAAIMKDIEGKSNLNLSEEKEYILGRFKSTDVPMFKVNDMIIDDKGVFLDIRGNPYYRNIDEDHKKYFDAVWKSLEDKYINGMSLNFTTPADGIIKVNDNLSQIDDADVLGITLQSGAANDMATITEVAIRCLENVEVHSKCQNRIRML